MIFSIIIPALDEEAAVEDILRRCLRAGERIVSAGLGVGEVEVILVNDGSRDRTEERARAVAGVQVVAHGRNRGYGAAIKSGFEAARGEWLGFLDADGTCDPEFFRDLLAFARSEDLDVALGSRMHPGSRMPALRVAGNRLFRSLVNAIGSTDVTDVASGMRVLRRTALDRLYPLPDGLHFTPAMSVRAVLDPALRIGEIPMPYEERIGRSKLRAVRDGLRFLRTILGTSLTYRPLTFLAAGAAVAATLATALLLVRAGAPTAAPVPFYFSHGYVEEWMFFRLMLTAVLLASTVFLLALGMVAQSLVDIINRREQRLRPGVGLAGAVMKRFALWGGVSLVAAVVLNRRPLASYLGTGNIPPEHWIFPVIGVFFMIVGVEFLGFAVVARIAGLLWERERFRTKAG